MDRLRVVLGGRLLLLEGTLFVGSSRQRGVQEAQVLFAVLQELLLNLLDLHGTVLRDLLLDFLDLYSNTAHR